MRKTKHEIMEGVDCDKSRIVGQNTVEYWKGETKVIRFHLTDIITFHDNGDIILNSGGWRTVTTKARMNEFSPSNVYVRQENSIWYVEISGQVYAFNDGITIHKDGSVTGRGEDPKAKIRLKKDIKKYAKDYMKELFAGNVPAPDNGDCWGCLFTSKDKDQPMGTDHLLDHMTEKYYVPSLLTKAIESISVSEAAKSVLGFLWGHHTTECDFWNDIAKEQLERSLKRYMFMNLGFAK